MGVLWYFFIARQHGCVYKAQYCYGTSVCLSVHASHSGTAGIENVVKVVQRNGLRWYGHVLRKVDNDCVKMCYFGL